MAKVFELILFCVSVSNVKANERGRFKSGNPLHEQKPLYNAMYWYCVAKK